MAKRNHPHIFIPSPPTAEEFTPARAGGGETRLFTANRISHGRRLKQEFQQAWPLDDQEEGTTIAFESFPGLDLVLESLDPQGPGEQPELLSVSKREVDGVSLQAATVFIPFGKKEYFLKRLDDYVATATNDKAKNAKLVEGIRSIRRATIRELWTDPEELFPSSPSDSRWWEVWLRKRDGREQERLSQYAADHQLRTSNHYLGFNDRTVVLLKATANQLAETFVALDDIAELRQPHEVSSFLIELPASEQREWVDDLRSRLEVAGPDAPVVCVLDTGVQDAHPLLSDSLNETDLHTADPTWALRPADAHGTEMAGIALYYNLSAALTSGVHIRLSHRLESVKILPDRGANDGELYGAVTARAVDRPEIAAVNRSRVFMLAVTAPVKGGTADAGRPSSWSAAVDALAFGRAIDDTDPKLTYLDRDEVRRPRLFVVSAGNIRDLRPADDHLARSDTEPIEDPAQAWNALTVGAYSPHDDMAGAPADFAGWVPVAPRGELAPTSRTSVMLDRRKWPFKPEVVADGGNMAVAPNSTDIDAPPNLALLTTRLQRTGEGHFTTTRDTSAATAQVASIAAEIMAAYPRLRPETVRGLIVHSAEWTPAMRAQIDAVSSRKSEIGALLRRYGLGVPNAMRATLSAIDALTLVAESQIHPFKREGSGEPTLCEMNLHELPWPAEQLEAMGSANVRLRVTLSYFVEPNPSNRGWNGRYAYPSHGLRFTTKRAVESVAAFRERINTRARNDNWLSTLSRPEGGWLFGADQQQAPGSLHTDIWTGTAADLASKGAIAVYPVAGWWKRRPRLDQSKLGVDYSLVVSIESPDVEVDLWTPVWQQIAPTVEIKT